MNIFNQMPEFIISDVRVKRPIDVSYRIDGDFMNLRHQSMMPANSLKNKKVLDLGCAVAATGAWALHFGASYYKGVEIQEKMVESASLSLGKYFPAEKWSMDCMTIEKFLKENKEQYDITVVSGVIYGIADYFGFLRELTKITKECIIIESMHPWKLLDKNNVLTPMDFWVQMTDFPIVQYTQKIRHSHQDGEKSYEYDGVRISTSAFEQIFSHLGWKVSMEANDQLERSIPDVYNVAHVAKSDPLNPGDAHLLGVASGPRFVIKCYPDKTERFDFNATLARGEEFISFKSWK